jgi:hypothetical protein
VPPWLDGKPVMEINTAQRKGRSRAIGYHSLFVFLNPGLSAADTGQGCPGRQHGAGVQEFPPVECQGFHQHFCGFSFG